MVDRFKTRRDVSNAKPQGWLHKSDKDVIADRGALPMGSRLQFRLGTELLLMSTT